MGTDARIEINRTFYAPTGYRVVRRDRTVEEYARAYEGHGLREEAKEVARCLREGLRESPVLPTDETLAVMETMDAVRARIGLDYSRLG